MNKIILKNLIIFPFLLTCLLSEEPLSIGFWNVENLFDLINDPNKNDDEFALGGRKKIDQRKYDLKIKNSSEVISDLDVDILGLCEVENIKVLNDLNEAYAKRNYSIIHYESPDNRGIDNALLFDKNRFSIISSKAIQNPLNGGGKTRDILYVSGIYQNSILHIYINHWPSNYGGKEKAIPKRKLTAELIIEEIQKIKQITEGGFYDVVIDATGSNKSMSNALEYVAFGGSLVYVGITTENISFTHPSLHRREISLLASRNALPKDFPRIINLIEDGTINTNPWITHRLEMDDVIDQFNLLSNQIQGL